MLQIRPVSDLRNRFTVIEENSRLVEDVEYALDVADRVAEKKQRKDILTRNFFKTKRFDK